MLRTLRWRFVLSHVLPLAIIMPVMGIALVYVLETQVLLGILSEELEGQALLSAKIAAGRPAIWTDPEQARIFAPFYRSQPGRRFPQGMGLGLSIAHTLVAAHDGRLELDSTPGLGSHFTVWLPLNSQENQHTLPRTP